MTRAQQAGLRIEDVARPSLKKRARRYGLDAAIRAAISQLAPGQPRRTAKKARRSKAKKGPT
jgi:hypothetical protein